MSAAIEEMTQSFSEIHPSGSVSFPVNSMPGSVSITQQPTTVYMTAEQSLRHEQVFNGQNSIRRTSSIPISAQASLPTITVVAAPVYMNSAQAKSRVSVIASINEEVISPMQSIDMAAMTSTGSLPPTVTTAQAVYVTAEEMMMATMRKKESVRIEAPAPVTTAIAPPRYVGCVKEVPMTVTVSDPVYIETLPPVTTAIQPPVISVEVREPITTAVIQAQPEPEVQIEIPSAEPIQVQHLPALITTAAPVYMTSFQTDGITETPMVVQRRVAQVQQQPMASMASLPATVTTSHPVYVATAIPTTVTLAGVASPTGNNTPHVVRAFSGAPASRRVSGSVVQLSAGSLNIATQEAERAITGGLAVTA